MKVIKFDIGYINQNIMPNLIKKPKLLTFYKNLV